MVKEISITEAQRRIVELVNDDHFSEDDTDNDGRIVIYTGLYLRDGKIYDGFEEEES